MHACAFTVQRLHGGVACASPKIPCIAWRCVDAAFARVARAVRAMASALLACAWPRLRVLAGHRKRVRVQLRVARVECVSCKVCGCGQCWQQGGMAGGVCCARVLGEAQIMSIIPHARARERVRGARVEAAAGRWQMASSGTCVEA